MTLRAVFLQRLRGEPGTPAGPAWVRVGHGSGLWRPLAGGSHAAIMGGRDTAATDAADPHPYSHPSSPRVGPGLLSPFSTSVVPTPGLRPQVRQLSSPYSPRRVIPAPVLGRPCPSRQLSGGSARGPISRRPFPGDSAGGAVSARSPASGSRAEQGRLWLRRRAAQGGSAEAMGMARAASRVSGTPGGPRPFSRPQFPCP